jgi:AcrR family transcriptional regulator
MSLISEKAYDAIVVKEILDRANIGRTTFYTHFRDKDELLASSIQEMLSTHCLFAVKGFS